MSSKTLSLETWEPLSTELADQSFEDLKKERLKHLHARFKSFTHLDDVVAPVQLQMIENEMEKAQSIFDVSAVESNFELMFLPGEEQSLDELKKERIAALWMYFEQHEETHSPQNFSILKELTHQMEDAQSEEELKEIERRSDALFTQHLQYIFEDYKQESIEALWIAFEGHPRVRDPAALKQLEILIEQIKTAKDYEDIKVAETLFKLCLPDEPSDENE